jgi:hypothetical protein
MLTEINNNLEAIKEFAKKQNVDPLADDWIAYNERIDLNFWNGKVIAYSVDERGLHYPDHTLNEFVIISE